MAKGKRNDNVDWYQVKERYIQGATWDQLETEFDVSRGAIHKHVADEEWDVEKARRQNEIAKQIQNNHIKRTVKNMVEFNAMCEEGADAACLIARNLIIRMANRMKEDKQGYEPDAKKLLDLLRIERESLEIKRMINGIVIPEPEPIPDRESMLVESLNGDSQVIKDAVNEVFRHFDF